MGARQKILEFNLLDAATFAKSITAMVEWERRPDAAMWFEVCLGRERIGEPLA